jgi:CO/xanthine dehydrogenase FAD-binding subunit
VYPRRFQYLRANTTDEALKLLEENEDAKVIAGGQSLIPMMKLRIFSPRVIIDISKIKELNYIRVEGREVRIGALVTHSEIEESELVRENIPLLSETASNIADLQVRSLGTIGGSISHADPSADYYPTLLALEAKVCKRSRKRGKTCLPISDFIQGPFTTKLERDEIVEEIVIPKYRGIAYYEKFSIRKADFALVNLAMILNYDKGEKEKLLVKDFRIALGSLKVKPSRLIGLESKVKNSEFKDFKSFSERLLMLYDEENVEFQSTIHGSSLYRREVSKTLISRLLNRMVNDNG